MDTSRGVEGYPPHFDYPMFGRTDDQIANYGSIIKDLTDTDALIEKFRLHILGKEMREDGSIYTVRDVKIDEEVAYDIISLVRSVVNQNTHFSRFDEGLVQSILKSMNYHLNRYLMLQGPRVPLRFRANIATEAMALCTASLYKAAEGNILKWTKGTFMEGRKIQEGPTEKKSIWSKVFGGR